MKNKKINVLATGVGAIIGYGIVRNLKKSVYDLNVIGVDIFCDAIGQKWCDIFVQGVRANDENFIDFIIDVVRKHSIDIVIPGIQQDIISFVNHFERLPQNVSFVLNNIDFINVLHNKKKTYKLLKDIAPLIPSIEYSKNSYANAVASFGLPFILKKSFSQASKGVAIISNKTDFDYFIYKFGENCLLQRKFDIENKEYTCSIFGLGDGNFVNPTCLLRQLSLEGSTNKAVNVKINEDLIKVIARIAAKCKFIGPTNLQFIKNQSEYLLLEINPRTSSSTSIREVFGVNEAEMCIDYFLYNKTPKTKKQKYGKVIRYIEDIYFDCTDF